MVTIFPKLRFGLLVGIAGGVPSKKHPIQLGDVVVSKPDREKQHGGKSIDEIPNSNQGILARLTRCHATAFRLHDRFCSLGVVQYDYGKLIQGQGLKINGVLSQPPEVVLSGLGKVRAAPIRSSKFMEYLSKYNKQDYSDILFDRNMYDRLFPRDCLHIEVEDTWDYVPQDANDHVENDCDADDPCRRLVSLIQTQTRDTKHLVNVLVRSLNAVFRQQRKVSTFFQH